jgi:hypothetical protein
MPGARKVEERRCDLGDHPPDVGQAEVAAGVAVGEALVVEAEQVQDRGLEVVDVRPGSVRSCDVVQIAEIVGCADVEVVGARA